MGDAQLGAHQIASQLFFFLALILDAVAIAGQVIVGRMLGAEDGDGAYAAAMRMIVWSLVVGAVFAIVLLPLGHVVPRAFSDDPLVLHRAAQLWPYFALMQPARGRGVRARRHPDRRGRHRVSDVVDGGRERDLHHAGGRWRSSSTGASSACGLRSTC